MDANSTGTLWSSGTMYVYWTKDGTVLNTTLDNTVAFADNAFVLSSYRGTTDLVVNFGRTIIDGEDILTRTITADKIKANTLDASVMRTNVAIIDRSAQIAND